MPDDAQDDEDDLLVGTETHNEGQENWCTINVAWDLCSEHGWLCFYNRTLDDLLFP